MAPGDQVNSVLKDSDFEVNEEGYTSQNSGGDDWERGTNTEASSQYWTVPSNGSQQLFYVNDDECDCDMSNVKLITPTLDFSNLITADITFNTFFEGNTYQGDTEEAHLQVSLNGGAFTNVEEIDGVNNIWREETINLNAYVGQSDVRLAFRYNDDGGWLYGFAVDDVLIEGTVAFEPDVATELFSSDEEDMNSGGIVYFYDNDNKLIAKLENGSSNFDCMDVVIDRAGFEPVPFWNNEIENALIAKTFLFTPQTNDPNGTYDITLYFSADEVLVWESITEKIFFEDAVIVKTPGPISEITPANPEPSNGFVEISLKSSGTLPYSGDYFITASFSSGFSGFGVGDPGVQALPVALTGFEGEHISGNGNRLFWSTANEVDNDYFILERSFDGEEFETIAKIDGAGNTNITQSYEFLDRTFQTGKNYYRLQQVDFDDGFSYSKTIVLDVEKNPIRMDIFPNPTNGLLNMVFNQPLVSQYQLEIFDVLGKQMMNQKINRIGEDQHQLDTSNLPNGVYFGQWIDVEGTTFRFRFVVEK